MPWMLLSVAAGAVAGALLRWGITLYFAPKWQLLPAGTLFYIQFGICKHDHSRRIPKSSISFANSSFRVGNFSSCRHVCRSQVFVLILNLGT